jgi:PAS domain S-box-containing protein
MRESEARFRDLVDGSVLPIQITTVDRSFVYANQMYLDLLGYGSADEFFEFRARVIAPHDRERIIDMAEARNRGEDVPQIYEYNAITKDGRFIPLQTHSREILWEGKKAYQRTFVDLTERKRTEEQLRQAQKMEVVGLLTGGIAHDFNNILTAITGNLELAADRVEQDSEIWSMVDRALDAAWRGATLARRLLAFSRRQALAPKAIDARALAEGMIDLLQRTLETSVSIEFMGDDGLWMCDADPGQLENAILNLAINARDAMPDGGKLTIETQNISLDDDYAAAQAEVTPGQYVVVAVTDTGAGMPQEIIDQVFDPFFTTKGIGKGSGLGLSMVFGFVNQSGGHVTVYSEVGVGTTVKLYLPRSRGEEPVSLPTGTSEIPRARGEIILVVEDDPSVRTLSVALLSDLGYEILEAADGPAALLILETSSHVDLLFTDVVLPGGMRGPELAAEIMRRRPGIAVLYTSGYTENAIVHHGRLDEGVELLNKPFRREDLARRVRAVLDRSHE